jgi:hypothetical protein
MLSEERASRLRLAVLVEPAAGHGHSAASLNNRRLPDKPANAGGAPIASDYRGVFIQSP